MCYKCQRPYQLLSSTNTVKGALKAGGNVYDMVLTKDRLSKEQLDEMLKPENMNDLWQIPKA